MIRRLAATTGVAASLLCATVMAAPVAAAAGAPTQVALLVQYPDGSVQTSCVGYSSGMTGADVLRAQNPTYGSGPYQGFVLRINGSGNTKDTPPSDSTYWAYWRSTGGTSYSYSGAGVTSTRPTAGSVEAWVWYQNGEVPFQKPSYSSLCPAGFAAPAAPATSAAAPDGNGATGGSAASGGGAGAAASAAAGSSRPSASGDGSTATGDTSAPTAPTGGPTPSATPATPRAGSSAAPSGRTTSVAASDVAARTDGGVGTGQTVGLLVAGVAVLGLGGTALVIRRRRTEAD